MSFDPDLDGIDHINVYSQGKTALGRWLSNFTYAPIELPEGRFSSIEGYWYYLGCDHPDKEQLKLVYGFNAKRLGKALRGGGVPSNVPDFEAKILNAIAAKLAAYPEKLGRLRANILPVVHYYNFKGKIVVPQDFLWVLDAFCKEVIK